MDVFHSERSRVLLVVLAFVVVVAAAGCFAYLYPPARESVTDAWSVLRLPSDLRNATFVSYKQGIPQLVQVKGLKYVPTGALHSKVFAYAHVGTTTVFSIGGLPTSTTTEPYGIFIGDTGIAQEAAPIPTVAISPDGNIIAYSVAATSTGSAASTSAKTNGLFSVIGSPFYTTPDGWVTKLFLLLPQKEVTIGSGYSPLFIDSTHIVLFEKNGVFVLDTTTAKETLLLAQDFGTIGRPIQSPDRSLIGWIDQASKTFFLYRITPASIKLSASFPVPQGYLTLGNHSLYAIHNQGLWELALTGGKARLVDTFPKSAAITNLLSL